MSNNNPTPAFIKWALKEAQETTSSQEEANERFAQLVWERAQTQSKLNWKSAALNYSEHSVELRKRFNFAREVARNTMRKFSSYSFPEFGWAYSTDARILGIYRSVTQYGQTREVNIESELAKGDTKLSPNNHYLLVEVGNGSNKQSYKVPVSYLNNDPIAVAQAVRSEVKRQRAQKIVDAEKTASDELLAAKKAKVSAENALNKALKDLQELTAQREAKAQKVLEKRSRALTVAV